MGQGKALKKMIKLADYLDAAGEYQRAGLIDYFIKKFADNDPTRLSEVFDGIPDEEKPDLILAIKVAKEEYGKANTGLSFNIGEQSDKLIDEIYSNIRNSDYNPKEVINIDNYGDVTLSEIFNELGIIG